MRKFLIAYNINLVATKEQAHRIALNLRSQGRKDMPGRLKAVQVVICQINIFFHPLTQNMKSDFVRLTTDSRKLFLIKNTRTICVNLHKSEEYQLSYFRLIDKKNKLI